MNFRRSQRTFLGNPVLVGALTVLAAIVVVTLAYQANNGLPFVPRYTLHVQIATPASSTRGGEVHEGGALVGNVQTHQRHPRQRRRADRAADAEAQQDRASRCRSTPSSTSG